MTGHNWASGIAMATPIAHKGANHGAQVVAMTAVDVLTEPGLVEEAWRYHREVQTKEYQWQSLIPLDTPPPIHLNEARMARFRPLLEKLRYDSTRYGTYLEQLGIDYPPVREDAARKR
ncbi:MAG: hypothetical protein ACE5HV_04075 [Acidobacteriota bacterium]